MREEGSGGWRVFRGDRGVGGLGRHEDQGKPSEEQDSYGKRKPLTSFTFISALLKLYNNSSKYWKLEERKKAQSHQQTPLYC